MPGCPCLLPCCRLSWDRQNHDVYARCPRFAAPHCCLRIAHETNKTHHNGGGEDSGTKLAFGYWQVPERAEINARDMPGSPASAARKNCSKRKANMVTREMRAWQPKKEMRGERKAIMTIREKHEAEKQGMHGWSPGFHHETGCQEAEVQSSNRRNRIGINRKTSVCIIPAQCTDYLSAPTDGTDEQPYDTRTLDLSCTEKGFCPIGSGTCEPYAMSSYAKLRWVRTQPADSQSTLGTVTCNALQGCCYLIHYHRSPIAQATQHNGAETSMATGEMQA